MIVFAAAALLVRFTTGVCMDPVSTPLLDLFQYGLPNVCKCLSISSPAQVTWSSHSLRKGAASESSAIGVQEYGVLTWGWCAVWTCRKSYMEGRAPSSEYSLYFFGHLLCPTSKFLLEFIPIYSVSHWSMVCEFIKGALWNEGYVVGYTHLHVLETFKRFDTFTSAKRHVEQVRPCWIFWTRWHTKLLEYSHGDLTRVHLYT